jgi:hypothetical protein
MLSFGMGKIRIHPKDAANAKRLKKLINAAMGPERPARDPWAAGQRLTTR